MQTHIPEIAHQRLWERVKWYFITGGLPEVVATFCANRTNLFGAFEEVRAKQEQILIAYFADIAKHAGKVNAMHIHRVLESVPAQMARSQDGTANKFKFRDVVPGIDRYQRLANAIDWLTTAGLIIKIPVVNYGQAPLKAYTKEGQFKLLLFDVGILGAMIRLSVHSILSYDYGTYKGYFAENYVAQELIASLQQPIYSWQKNRNQIEFLCELQGEVIPIEVKSGSVVQSNSLQKYIDKYHPSYSVIMSANNLSVAFLQARHCYSLYLANRFPLY
ncbi:MAG: DUF4143 domain-containing protein [Proteobacteria bacterium]|nr:DUF4143 domain-containing protein [Pseudomonadota bacterium]